MSVPVFDHLFNSYEMDAIIQAKKRGKAKDIIIIDIREAYEIKKSSPFPFSIHIASKDIPRAFQQMSNRAFKDQYKIDKPTKTSKVVLVCSTGQRSGVAMKLLLEFGYKFVSILTAGTDDYKPDAGNTDDTAEDL